MWKIVLCAALLSCSAVAQPQPEVTARDPNAGALHGTTPRRSPSEYPASVDAYGGKATVAAEFMGHTIPGERTTFAVDDYIVVEIAVYPAKGQSIVVSTGDFQLRLNKKRVLLTQAPQAVAAAMKYPDWSTSPKEVDVTMGDADIRVGRPQPVGRFPGDPTTQNRYPRRRPSPTREAGVVEPQSGFEAAVYSALVEGRTIGPASGLIYFEYKGKLKNLKSLELLVRGAGEAAQVLSIR